MATIDFVTPRTTEELETLQEEFLILNGLLPKPENKETFLKQLPDKLGWMTLIYIDGVYCGGFWIQPSKKSAQLHGVFRENVGLQNYGRLKVEVQKIVMQRVFKLLKKNKIIIKGDPEHKGIRGFALMWGFKRVNNIDKGNYVWKLTREQFYERLKRLRLDE